VLIGFLLAPQCAWVQITLLTTSRAGPRPAVRGPCHGRSQI
jgi:hypothetical protein